MLALIALVVFVIAPPRPRVSRERRLAPGQEYESALSKVTKKTTEALEQATSSRAARWFNAEELELAGIKTDPSGFLVLVIAATAVFALIGVLLGFGSWRSILLGILFAIAGPIGAKIMVSVRISRRRAAFAEQIDDTVQLLAGGLRAGHGLARTLASVATESESPMAEELTRVVNETRLGRNLPDALTTTAIRMRSADFEWMSQAIAINQETGGNLAEVLDQVGATIRERNQIRRQVKALSAEGRLSGVILVALPIGVFVLLLIIRPEYLSTFFTNPFGVFALIFAAILIGLGAFWISRVTKVEF
jgi:tight adherence protein B